MCIRHSHGVIAVKHPKTPGSAADLGAVPAGSERPVRECAVVLKAPQPVPRHSSHRGVHRALQLSASSFQGGATLARGIWSDNMWRVDRRRCATLALIALGNLGLFATVDAQGADPRERHAQRPSEGGRQAARRETYVRQSHRTRAAPAQGFHAAARREPSYAREPVANQHREMAGRGVSERRMATRSVVREPYLAGGGRVGGVSRGLAGRQVRVVRYGNTLSGTVERTIRPGLVSRTFVSGGHVL